MEHIVNFFFLLSCYLAWSLTKEGIEGPDAETDEFTRQIFNNKISKGILASIWFIFLLPGSYYLIRFIYYGVSGVYEQIISEVKNPTVFWLLCLAIVTTVATATTRFKMKK
jgi:hypothetical protein